MLFPPLFFPLSYRLQSRMPQLTPLSPPFHRAICVISPREMRHFMRWNTANHATNCLKSFYALLSTTPTFLITPQTTPSICKANYSSLSSENHRSQFVKPAKRGLKSIRIIVFFHKRIELSWRWCDTTWTRRTASRGKLSCATRASTPC